MSIVCGEYRLTRPLPIPAAAIEHRLDSMRVLVIAPELPTWIVLIGEVEHDAYRFISEGLTLDEVGRRLEQRHGHGASEHLSSVLIEMANQDFVSSATSDDAPQKCNLTIYLTNACNLRCGHCFRHAQKPGKELDTGTWTRILEGFADLPECGKYVTFSGGEPCMRPDWTNVVKASDSLGLRNVLLTNGTLITRESLMLVIQSIYEIQISIDGTTAAIHDRIRGDGTYGKLMSRLDVLGEVIRSLGCHPRVAIAMTPMPWDVEEIERTIRDFVDQIQRRIGTEVLLRMTTRLKPGRSLRALTAQEATQYKRDTQRIRALIYDDPYWNEKVDSTRFGPLLRVRNCGFGQHIGIQPDGQVFACYDATEEYMGNASVEPLSIIWSRLKELFRTITVELSSVCSGCELKYICGGGCRLENRRIHGGYLQPACCVVDKDWKPSIMRLMAARREWSWRPFRRKVV